MGARRNKRSRPAKPYRAGLIVIHGVGNQKLGKSTDRVTNRIDKSLSEVGLSARVGASSAVSGSPVTTELFIESSRPVLIAEGYWADLIRQARGKELRSFLQRLWFGIPVLPFLIAAALGPRAHESSLFTDTRKKTTWRSLLSFKDEWEFARRAWPTAWRCLTLIAVVLLAVAGVKQLGAAITLALLGALLIASWFLLRGRWDVLEHLRVAALGTETLTSIEDRLISSIDHLSAQCDEVWVVGHSQGGYLAHRLLSGRGRGRWLNVTKYTGLASGMRPIELISTYREWRWAVSGWLGLLAGLLVMAGTWVASEPGGLLNSDGWRQTVGTQLLLLVRPDLLLTGQLPELPMSAIVPTDWSSVLYFVAGVVLLAASVILGMTAGRTKPSLAALPTKIEWEELASPSDLVGSMSVPEVPGAAKFRVVPSLRQPILDHPMTAYFRPRSLFRFEAARWVSGPGASRTAFVGLEDAELALRDLTERTYRLRFGVQMTLIVPAVLLPLALGSSLFALATSYLTMGVVTALVVAGVAALWWFVSARRITTRFTTAAKTKKDEFKFVAPRKRPTWAVIGCALTGVLGALAAYGLTVYGQLVAADAPDEQAVALAQGVSAAGIRMMSVALVTFLAVSFAAAQVRGVRVLLLVGATWTGSVSTTFDQIGAPWVAAGMPGMMITIVVMWMLVFGAIACWRKRPSLRA